MPPESETPAQQPAKPTEPPAELPWYIALIRRERATIKGAPFAFVSCVIICNVLLGIGIFRVEEWRYGRRIAEKEDTIENMGVVVQKKDVEIETLKLENERDDKYYSRVIADKDNMIGFMKQPNEYTLKGPTTPLPAVNTQIVESTPTVTPMDTITQPVSEVGSVEPAGVVRYQINNLIGGQKIVLDDAPMPQTVKIWVNVRFGRPIMLNNNASLDGNIITLTNFSNPQVNLIRDQVKNGTVFVEYVKNISYKPKNN